MPATYTKEARIMAANVAAVFPESEPTYTAREAAVLLRRSYSWIDQRVRRGEFARADGTVVQPRRTAGGYRYFTSEMLRDIRMCCYRHRWYSFDDLVNDG
jgi:hypothetical protein